MEIRRPGVLAAIVRESRLIRKRERGEPGPDGSDMAWLFAALPAVTLLGWLIIVAQH